MTYTCSCHPLPPGNGEIGVEQSPQPPLRRFASSRLFGGVAQVVTMAEIQALKTSAVWLAAGLEPELTRVAS